jgi:hypothetical protein
VCNAEHYTPPFSVRKMTEDLAFLPAWYAEEGDRVLINRETFCPFSSWLPETLRPPALPLTRKTIRDNRHTLPPMEAAPWGMSRSAVALFDELKRTYGLSVDIPPWKDEYAGLTSRRTAAGCLAGIRQLLPGTAFPPQPVFFSEMEELDSYLLEHPGSFVLKMPYSSSGRGLLWLEGKPPGDKERKRIEKILRKQKEISLEYALDKEMDFALEFYSDGKGNVRYEGLSLFHTDRRGAYRGNRLQAQTALWKQLQPYAGKATADRIRQTVAHVLAATFGPRYAGYIGVDMLVYKNKDASFGIHPCIEINLRYTMGMAAIRIFRNCMDSSATGMFHILHEKNHGQAYERHLFMTKTCPPEVKNGKLRKGYLALCPVTENTRYTAYILAT